MIQYLGKIVAWVHWESECDNGIGEHFNRKIRKTVNICACCFLS